MPLAVIQAYAIYTPYLDKISAEKILNKEAPEYILLTLDTIDNRWPFIECPQTWEAIRNNYYIKLQKGNLFLLQHREIDKKINYNLVRASEYARNDVIELEGADYLKISANLSIWGKLVKIFWEIPEINMRVCYSDGTEITRRALLNMFSEGVELGILANTNETLIDILNDAGHLSTVTKIVFEGNGLKYYKNNINVEFYTSSSDEDIYPNNSIKTAYAEEMSDTNFLLFDVKGGVINYSIDFEAGNKHYKRLEGWAYITDMNLPINYSESEICVEINGKYYKCDKISREDVKAAFDLSTDLVGYSVLYNSGEKGNICIIDMENCTIYK